MIDIRHSIIIKCHIKSSILKEIVLSLNGFTLDPGDSSNILRDNDILKTSKQSNDDSIRGVNSIKKSTYDNRLISSPTSIDNTITNTKDNAIAINTTATKATTSTATASANTTANTTTSAMDSTQVWHFLKKKQEEDFQQNIKNNNSSNKKKKQKLNNRYDSYHDNTADRILSYQHNNHHNSNNDMSGGYYNVTDNTNYIDTSMLDDQRNSSNIDDDEVFSVDDNDDEVFSIDDILASVINEKRRSLESSNE